MAGLNFLTFQHALSVRQDGVDVRHSHTAGMYIKREIYEGRVRGATKDILAMHDKVLFKNHLKKVIYEPFELGLLYTKSS